MYIVCNIDMFQLWVGDGLVSFPGNFQAGENVWVDDGIFQLIFRIGSSFLAEFCFTSRI